MMTSIDSANLQASFLEVLPRIEARARVYFRDVRCAVKKADCIAETIGLAWKWFCRLVQRGKDVMQFVSALASLAARAVRAGRRACGLDRANDVMSPVAQRRHGFTVVSLPSMRQSHEDLNGAVSGQRLRDIVEERLRDNTLTPVPDQASFRIDFPSWVKSLSPRERRILKAMSTNERTKELSRRFAVSPGRISQLRRQFRNDWRRFVGDDEVTKE
jgi:hypothetical protein